MIKRAIVTVLTVAAVAGLGVQAAGAAQNARGVTHYRNCRAMQRDWDYGVARSRAAANAEVADGYGRPHVSRALYRVNRELDANDDGVACEA